VEITLFHSIALRPTKRMDTRKVKRPGRVRIPIGTRGITQSKKFAAGFRHPRVLRLSPSRRRRLPNKSTTTGGRHAFDKPRNPGGRRRLRSDELLNQQSSFARRVKALRTPWNSVLQGCTTLYRRGCKCLCRSKPVRPWIDPTHFTPCGMNRARSSGLRCRLSHVERIRSCLHLLVG